MPEVTQPRHQERHVKFVTMLSESEFFQIRDRVEQKVNAWIHGARFHAAFMGVLLLLAVAVLVAPLLEGGEGSVPTGSWIAIPAQALVAALAFFLFRARRRGRALLRKECGPFPVAQEIEFDADGIAFTLAGARIHHPWTRLRQCERDGDTLYLYLGLFVLAIPWRAVTEDAVYAELAACLAAHGSALPAR